MLSRQGIFGEVVKYCGVRIIKNGLRAERPRHENREYE